MRIRFIELIQSAIDGKSEIVGGLSSLQIRAIVVGILMRSASDLEDDGSSEWEVLQFFQKKYGI